MPATRAPYRTLLHAAIVGALGLSLAACGGGGGNTRPTVTPPPPAPAPPPAPEYDNSQLAHLDMTGAQSAHERGYTGAGVKIGIVDTKADIGAPWIKDRVAWYESFGPDDVSPIGHGSKMAQLIAGGKTRAYAGGIAPGSDLYIAAFETEDHKVNPIFEDINGKGSLVSNVVDRGARIVNVSLGGPCDVNECIDLPFFDNSIRNFDKYVGLGVLFVISAGNKGPDVGNYQSYTPVVEKDLQKGIINVVALDFSRDLTTFVGKKGYSAICGVTAEWCLGAPGDALVNPPFEDGYDPDSPRMITGTSISAAIVTGVAALTSEAFPWMDNDNLRQTILTSATRLCGSIDAGYVCDDQKASPNEIYGWGLVNADKAVDGPEQFYFGAFNANIGSYHSTFANAISGDGNLVLTGTTGVLTLTANNTYSGGTDVQGATLHLTGSIASDVTVGVDGRLAGDGVVKASVSNAGIVASVSGDAGKGLTVRGDYTAQADSTTAIGIGNPMTVGKTASLDGTLKLLPAVDEYQPHSTETLLEAGAVEGEFANTGYADSVFYTAEVSYGADKVTAKLDRKNVAKAMAFGTPVLVSTASGVEKALAKADAWSESDYAGHRAFLNKAAHFLSATTTAQAVASLKSLSGQMHGTVNAIEVQHARLIDDTLAVQQAQESSAPGVSLWMQQANAAGSLTQHGYASARYHANGSLVGAQYSFGAPATVGVALGRHDMGARLAGLAGNYRGKADTAAIYGRFALGSQGYLNARALWSDATLNTRRTALIGTDMDPLTATRSDEVASATVEAGWTFGGDTLSYTPYASIGAMRIHQGAFSEDGGDGFGLKALGQNHGLTNMQVGLRMAHSFGWAGGWSSLTGNLAWRQVLSGAGTRFAVALNGAQEARFLTSGQSVARGTASVGANLYTKVNRHWSWYLNASVQKAQGQAHAVAGRVGIQYHF